MNNKVDNKLYFFSIVICCYNSALLIPKTLEYLSNLIYDDVNYPCEIIIVDNNSKDDTILVANSIKKNLNISIPFKVVTENRQGLSFARNKGIQESGGQYILFCDDDNWLEKDYLLEAYKILSKDKFIGMLGGKGEPISNITLPVWFKSELLTYAVGKQNDFDGDISKIKAYVYGAACIVKKSLIEILLYNGFENVLTDRLKRNSVTGGGDNELGYAIVIMGYKIYYSEKLKFKHFISQNRLTEQYLLKFKKGLVYTSRAVSFYENYIFYNQKEYNKISFYNYVKKNIKNLFKITKQLILLQMPFLTYRILFTTYFYRILYYYTHKKIDFETFKKINDNIELITKLRINE